MESFFQEQFVLKSKSEIRFQLLDLACAGVLIGLKSEVSLNNELQERKNVNDFFLVDFTLKESII